MNLRIVSMTFVLSSAILSCEKDNNAKDKSPEWNKVTELPGTGRQNAVSFSIAQKGYMGLGNGDATAVYNDFWEFDPHDSTWARQPDFPGIERGAPTSFSIGNK